LYSDVVFMNERLEMGPFTGSGASIPPPFGFEPEPITVLHVDDDPNDTELLRAASRRARVPFQLENVEDGEQAIAYLSGAGVYANREKYRMPALVLLDIKMPRTTGFEVLKWIKGRAALAHVPVVVLSGSELQDDIQEAYASGASSYFIKPLVFDALVNLIRSINTIWLAAKQKTQDSAR
jgi:CheY-like chemotaxis protein